MSPEIYARHVLIADVPDRTGVYRAFNGDPLEVEFDPENPNRVIVQTRQLAGEQRDRTEQGRREFVLNHLGIGISAESYPAGVAVIRLHEQKDGKGNVVGINRPQVLGASRRRNRGHGRR